MEFDEVNKIFFAADKRRRQTNMNSKATPTTSETPLPEHTTDVSSDTGE